MEGASACKNPAIYITQYASTVCYNLSPLKTIYKDILHFYFQYEVDFTLVRLVLKFTHQYVPSSSIMVTVDWMGGTSGILKSTPKDSSLSGKTSSIIFASKH